jgi:hypothetical protein
LEQLVIVLEVVTVLVSYRAKMFRKAIELTTFSADVQLTKSESKPDSQTLTENLRQKHQKGVKGPSNFSDDYWLHAK